VTISAELATWRVLVVDDEPDNLRLVADVLEFSGATVIQVSDARRGLAVVDEFHPTLILLDLSMPDMDGWELHRLLRSRPDTHDLPIIALTALAMPGDAERVKAAGFTGYISKPFRVRALITELQDLIRAAANGATPPSHDPT